LILVLICSSCIANAKDYPASLFGIYSDGVTLNTRSIQYAIDYIHNNGGGRLIFYVGRYLTGSIHLKSNVTIQLEEGAVLLGSLNPWDYDRKIFTALVMAYNQQNVGITGKGIIDGQGRQLGRNVVEMVHKGVLKDLFRYDRPEVENRAMLVNFRECENVLIKRITLRNAAAWVQTYDQCKNLTIDSIFVDSKAYWNNDGLDIVDCDNVTITNSYIDASDDAICLKSHDDKATCKNVLIMNNTARSSANGIKFGTASRGGFTNIKIINNKVYDTYRSAVTLAAVDGGIIEDVEVDSLWAYNTGNAFFLRIGERVKGRKGKMNNVRISNMYVEVPATKPDVSYEFQGPEEDMPRNISPSSITGLPDAPITNVTLTNIEIKHPGGGDAMFAEVALNELNKVSEKAEGYPEFSMFGELPAWGLYMRHAKNIQLNNVTLTCARKDYRTPIVNDDVQTASFKNIKITAPDKKKAIYSYQSSAISESNVR